MPSPQGFGVGQCPLSKAAGDTQQGVLGPWRDSPADSNFNTYQNCTLTAKVANCIDGYFKQE